MTFLLRCLRVTARSRIQLPRPAANRPALSRVAHTTRHRTYFTSSASAMSQARTYPYQKTDAEWRALLTEEEYDVRVTARWWGLNLLSLRSPAAWRRVP